MKNRAVSPKVSTIRIASMLPVLLLGLACTPGLKAEEAPQAQDQSSKHRGFRGHRNHLKPAERQARADEHFATLDTDEDGMITPQELDAAKMPGRKWGKRRHFKNHVKDENRIQMQEKLFQAMDTNSDATLSAAEFADIQNVKATLFKQEFFSHMDANKDGVLTRDEFPPVRNKRFAAAHPTDKE